MTSSSKSREARLRALEEAGIITDIVGCGFFWGNWVMSIYLPFQRPLATETFAREADARKAARMIELAYRVGYSQTPSDDRKLREARQDVVEIARRLSKNVAEFDGNLSYCGEYLDALWSAIDRLEAQETDRGIR